MNIRRIICISGFILLVAALATSVALAASPVRQYLTATVGSCNSTSAVVGGDVVRESDVPDTLVISQFIDGNLISSGGGTQSAGKVSGTWAIPTAFPAQPGDYDYRVEFLYIVDGQNVWHSTAGFRCVGGVPIGFFATHEDLTLSAGCTLDVPVGSVVGEAPLGAQAYYEPGNISPGVVLNPGTYIVIGQDESETYYKLVLACQYLWVRKDTMQPSYLPPQNGAPLPTTIVS